MKSKSTVQNKIIVNSIIQFNHQISQEFEENISYKIELHDPINPIYPLKNIELNPLFDCCQYLDLKIKGRHTDQNDFDHFFNQLGKFSVLKSIKFKFYNKRVEFLDNLLISVRKINEVNLNFKNFRKIGLLQDYKNINFQTEKLEINLQNAVIKENTIQKFADYIGAHSQLKQFHISMDKKCSAELLNKLTHQPQVNISFLKSNKSKKSIDQLISIVKNNNLRVHLNAGDLCTTMRFYLGQNGIIEFDSDFFNKLLNDNLLKLNSFNEGDFELLEELPYISNLLIQRSKQMKRQIKIYTTNLGLCFRYLISKINKYFDQIEFCIYCEYVYPNAYKYPTYQKILKYNNYSWQIEFTQDNDTNYLKTINNIVNLKLKINNLILLKKIQRFAFNFLKQQQYLIFLEDPKNIKNEKLNNLFSLARQRGTNFLRFLAFQKFISTLVPLSDQIFYDLLVND